MDPFDEPPELRDAPPELRCDELPELPDDELRPRDEAEGERRLEALPLLDDALPLLDLLRDALAPLRLLLLEALWLFGLDPFELLELACRLFEDLELAWATCPSLGRCPALQNSDTPIVVHQTRWVGRLQVPSRRVPAVRFSAPDWERTVHCLGDLHAGAITAVRLEAVSRDLERLGTPALHLQVGDLTERGTKSEDELALGFLERLPGRWVAALGNHDVLGNRRTPTAWARAYGRPSQNLSVELPFARVIVIGPDRTEPGRRAGRLPDATLEFLDDELAHGPEHCWIACHWPLLRSVMGDPRLHFTSTMDAFHAKPDTEIRALLARHRNAKLWLSGHTHSPVSAPGLIKRMRLAPRRSIVAINASALVGVGKRRNPRAPLCSLFLTKKRDSLEVRCRDHRAREWRRIRGRPMVEVETPG